eukprot:8580959-Pyramimonas_sp.AAC.1
MWFSILGDGRVNVERVRRGWARVLANLSSKAPRQRWRRVCSPMAATICTMLDLGWNPEGPWRWH